MQSRKLGTQHTAGSLENLLIAAADQCMISAADQCVIAAADGGHCGQSNEQEASRWRALQEEGGSLLPRVAINWCLAGCNSQVRERLCGCG